MTRSQSRRDPFGRLADALVEDILATREAELFAECAEDHGDARALSAEADKIIESIIGKDRAQSDAKTYEQPTWSTLNNGDLGAAPTVAERTTQARILGWPLVRRKPAELSGRLIGRNARSESFVRLAGFWRRRISADRGHFSRRFQMAIAAVVAFIAVTGTVALYRADHVATGSPDEFTRAVTSVNEHLPRELELRVSPPPSKGSPALAGDPVNTTTDAGPGTAKQGMHYVVKLAWQAGQKDTVVSDRVDIPELHAKYSSLPATIRLPPGQTIFMFADLSPEQASGFCAEFPKVSGVNCSIQLTAQVSGTPAKEESQQLVENRANPSVRAFRDSAKSREVYVITLARQPCPKDSVACYVIDTGELHAKYPSLPATIPLSLGGTLLLTVDLSPEQASGFCAEFPKVSGLECATIRQGGLTQAMPSAKELPSRESDRPTFSPPKEGSPAVAGAPTKTVIDARRPEDHTHGYLVKFSWQPGQGEVALSYLHTKFPSLAPKPDAPAVFLVGLTSEEASNFCAGIVDASGVECIIHPPAQ